MFKPVASCLLILLLCSFCISCSGASAHSAPRSSPDPTPAVAPDVSLWLTTTDGRNLLSPQRGFDFVSNTGIKSPIIDVNENQQFQQIVGFGASMTDTSAYLMGVIMNAQQRASLMQALFSPTQGIGVSFVRIPMGASDYTATPPINPTPYSYDDLPAGQTDPTLSHFSITHDEAYILPVLQQALKTNTGLTFMANPWSPPAWMKSNDSLIQGGTLLPADYQPLADYFVKFIQAYQAQGIPIYAITPQNEPTYGTDYSSMILPALDEANFIQNNLGPTLSQAKLSTKILAWDSNASTYPDTILSDAGASQYVSGVAWHCYGANMQVMTTIHTAYPTKDNYETECSTGPTGIAPYSAIDLALLSTQNWSRTVELWNLAVDSDGGPKIGDGCKRCTGLVTINQATGNYTFTPNYYGLGQISKFVQPGAYHIASTVFRGLLNTAAFKNPNGSSVLVVHNTSSASSTFAVRVNGTQSFQYTLPAGGIVTFQWNSNRVH